MAQPQEEGWPLGLQPLNAVRNRDLNASLSFNTLLTASSSDSSDLDSQSTGSFFHEKSITLGRLIGISSILELSSRRSAGGSACEAARRRKMKTKTWFRSLCSKASTDAVVVRMNNAPSLGQFLEAERNRSNPIPSCYGFSHVWDSNPLFVGESVAPPQNQETGLGLLHHEPPLLLSCLCANLDH